MSSLWLGLGLSLGPRPSGATTFSPASLFATTSSGVWYDPSDLATLWQDAAGTVPVTTNNDPVRRMDDKSGNANHLIAPGTAERPLYKAGGYLLFDGVDDVMTGSAPAGCATIIVGAQMEAGVTDYEGLFTNSTTGGDDVTVGLIRFATNATWFQSQNSGEGLWNSTHIWRNGGQVNAITEGAPAVYSADGTGHPDPQLRFPNAPQIGRDRQLSRLFNGRFYGAISIGEAAANILSTDDRNAAEAWMAAKCGVTL